MGKIHPEVLSAIKELDKKTLEKLVIKSATKDKQFHDYILVTFVSEAIGEQELFEVALQDIEKLQMKSFRARVPELKEAAKLAMISKCITAFDANCKNKKFTLELLLKVVANELEEGVADFGTCFETYDVKVASLLSRAIAIAQHKIHPDLISDYKSQINKLITELKKVSNHLDKVWDMEILE
jgi:predicted RNase H-related nuclease YkuK (DUF458 family)